MWQRPASPLALCSSTLLPSRVGAFGVRGTDPLPQPCVTESGLLRRSAPLPWVRACFSLLLNNSDKPAKGPSGDVGEEMLRRSTEQLMVGPALPLFVPRLAHSSSG